MISEHNFNYGHCLSASTQPAIGNLINFLRDPARRFTFVLGAGVSIDSGLPDWDRLVTRIAAKVDPEKHAKLALADRDEPMRKAEYVVQMRLASTPGSVSSVVQEALYQGVTRISPGSLAQSICSLFLALGDRASVITTNFDEVVETALNYPTMPRVKAFTLDDTGGWNTALSTAGTLPIMHLHGILPRSGDATRPLILTEAHFLVYGNKARKLFREALKSSVVVFVGVSLTDPNLVGPLWDTRDDVRDCFALSVPAPANAAEDIFDIRAYSLRKSEYLETTLKIQTIFLKSYSQLEQLVSELVVSTKDLANYDSRDPAISSGYGFRFSRTLEGCYATLGSTSGAGITLPARVNAANGLQAELTSGGRIANLLDNLRGDPGLVARFNDMKKEARDTTAHSDEFGLALWLRAANHTPDHIYSINLIASTGTILLGERQHMPFTNVRIEPYSPYLEPRAVSRGTSLFRDLPRRDALTGWVSGIAVPVRQIEDVNDAAGKPYNRSLTVGAICLTTTGHISNRVPPISWLAALDTDQKAKLAAELELIARDLLGI
jgi:hypothetical protein